jgi:platelet-activating factor acetylhydrolase IB subunit alpha
MVLTDRQRADLHAGIYEYLCSRPGDAFQKAAAAFMEAVPDACERHSGLQAGGTASKNGHTPLLEKKWTAIPRLQKKVLELEKQAAQNAKIHAHRVGTAASAGGGEDGSNSATSQRRMLPRLPATHTLAGHSMVVTCCAVHPVFTVAVSGSEDGTVKVRRWGGWLDSWATCAVQTEIQSQTCAAPGSKIDDVFLPMKSCWSIYLDGKDVAHRI